MLTRKDIRKSAGNTTIGQASVTLMILAVLFTALGCQPVKMYSGPELDRSQVALIRGEPCYWGEKWNCETRIYLVDGNPTTSPLKVGKKTNFILQGENKVLVLPGKHKVGITHETIKPCPFWNKTSFELTVEAGKTYEVKVRPIWSERQELNPSFRAPIRLWVEDVETGGMVPIQRLRPNDSVSVPLTKSRKGLFDWDVRRFYDAGGTKLPLDEVSILFVQIPAILVSVDDKKTSIFGQNVALVGMGRISSFEVHLLPGTHEIKAKMQSYGHSEGPLTKSIDFKKGHVYYLMNIGDVPYGGNWTFDISEVGTIHQVAPSLVRCTFCPGHWWDCWINAPDSTDIVFGRGN